MTKRIGEKGPRGRASRLLTRPLVIGASVALGAALTVIPYGTANAAAKASSSQLRAASVRISPSGRYIVEARSTKAASSSVKLAGGKVLSRLVELHGVVATLSAGQARHVALHVATIVPDASVTVENVATSSSTASHPSAVFPEVTGANKLWSEGDTGQGVTVAVLDTGIDEDPSLAGRVIDGVDLTGENNPYDDQYGHGTFVAGLIASDGATSNGQYMGEAPGADLVSIKVAGADGVTSEATVIEGIQWAIAHRVADNIRILNLSLGVEPTGPTADEPLDQAVQQAWNAGIVVVVSAGNAGPNYGTITSPGDDPLVITTGALDDDAGTNPANYSIPSFSSVGPTGYDGWFKPDLVAPGRSVISLAAPGSTVYTENPSAKIGSDNFVGSGTSFSAAIVSGLAALILERNPQLSPDQVKARLLSTAAPGPVDNPFVDGHGIASALAAQVSGDLTLNQSAAVAAESTSPSYPISLASTWAVSTWNHAEWSGSEWNGSEWNGSEWNGSEWNGSEWNGSEWNGSEWNGSEWNGSEWNVDAWDGSEWNGSEWNGSEWNGSEWNGSEWNGSEWNVDTWQ